MDKIIYILSPTLDYPSGGVNQLFKLQIILNKFGFDSKIVFKKYKRNNWYKNKANKIYNWNIFNCLKNDNATYFNRIKSLFYGYFFDDKIKDDAIIVIPEIFIPNSKKRFKYNYIIYNQNCYYTFENFFGDNFYNSLYFKDNLMGVVINSEDGYNYLRNGLKIPEDKLYKIKLGIDLSVFKFRSKVKNQIAFMPRKLPEDLKQVINILKIRGKINSWDFVSIDNKNENEVAEILKESPIFLSSSYREGLGLPPLEAMACGCLVVGYHGNGGKEYFKENNSILVNDRDILDYVLKVEKACYLFEKDMGKFLELSKESYNTILKDYSLEIEEKSTIEIFFKILDKL